MQRGRFNFPIIAALFLTACLVSDPLSAAPPDSLRQAANQAMVDYRSDLNRLADWDGKRGLRSEALQTRSAVLPSDSDRIYLPSFPLDVGTLDIPKGLPNTLPTKCSRNF